MSVSGVEANYSPRPKTTDGISVAKRLQSELMQFMMAAPPGISAFPVGDNMTEWSATIDGPSQTPYEGLSFKLKLKFSPNYPFAAPTVTFETPLFHPNVDPVGNICLDILKPEKWSAVYNVQTILLSIQSLLGDPNNDSPLNGKAARLWGNEVEYKKAVHEMYAARSA